MNPQQFRSKNNSELLEKLCELDTVTDHPIYKQLEATILVNCVNEINQSFSLLTNSINDNAKSNNKLSRHLFWLNLILSLATVVIACTGIINLCCIK